MSGAFALVSLGCAKNLVDSEDLVGGLRGLGLRLTESLPDADLILINTCGFVGDAKQESIDAILEVARDRRPGAKLVVAGCLTERYPDELAQGLPEVDLWLPFSQYRAFPRLAAGLLGLEPPARQAVGARHRLTPQHLAYLKIAEGCDNTCNFCAIPLIRGKHVSRPFAALVSQAAAMAADGVAEISLVSQHLDYYGADRYGRRRLAELVRAVARAAPAAWIRLHYCYPDRFGDDLIAAIAETPNVLHYLDLPIQHASDRILTAMRRRTSQRRLRDRLTAIRAALPDVVLRTAVITGFPGETERDHRDLLAFLDEMAFDHVGVFRFSPEEGTPAAALPGRPRAATVERRFHEICAAQALRRETATRRWLGRTVEVLVDGPHGDGRWRCRHAGQAWDVDTLTLVTARRLEPGRRVTVVIDGCDGPDLTAHPSV